ncbi:MAG: nucleotide exchange factor GrpE [Actinomycetales bacterium]|nr:nucleotide exchange factor GrpE [Actinomycetales bacterium]
MTESNTSDEGVEQLLDTLEAEIAADAATPADADARVAELVADLQRLQAEYANYRKRVDRDRDSFKEAGTAAALAELLPVLDDIERARNHDDLNGTFKVVAESLESAARKLGLEAFGDAGDAFDPTTHEAIAHETRDDVSAPTCVTVHQRGFRYAGRVMRPALVTVADAQ